MESFDYEFSRNAGRLRRFTDHDRKFIRRLRVHATGAEILLWELVRNKQILGLKFRRQHK